MTRETETRPLRLPVGGIEREIAVLPATRQDDKQYLTTRPLGLGLLHLFVCARNALEGNGGECLGLMDQDFRDRFATSRGDILSIESRNVIEYSTGEAAHFTDLVESAVRLDRLTAASLREFERNDRELHGDVTGDGDRPESSLTAHRCPSVIPGFPFSRSDGPLRARTRSRMWERSLDLHRSGLPYSLSYHVNVSAGHLEPEQSKELLSALAGLVLLTGSGGLGPRGFCASPNGARIRRGFVSGGARDGRPPYTAPEPYMATERVSPVMTEPWGIDRRLHVACFDSPFTRTGLAVTFGTVQLLAAMLAEGLSPTCGLRLADPAGALRKWSVNQQSRIPLEGGGKTDMSGVALAVRESLERLKGSYELDPWAGRIADTLVNGISALERSDEEYLTRHFQYFLKKLIYTRVLETYGLSLQRFNAAVPALMQATRLLTVSLGRLSRMRPAAITQRIRLAARRENRSALVLERYLAGHRMSHGDLAAFAGICQRLLTIEMHLGRIYPDEPIIEEHDRTLWRSFVERLPVSAPPRTRADKRGRLVAEAAMAGNAKELCMDWANIISLEKNDIEGVIAMPDPESPTAQTVRRITLEELLDNWDESLFGKPSLILRSFIRDAKRQRHRERGEGALETLT